MSTAVSEPRTWSFRGGDWFGIFGDRAAVVLPPSEKARVAALWELVDDGAGFDETLDALISGGLRDLPGFVLVSREGDQTRVVLRGAAQAHLATADDVVHVEGEGATTWVERTVRGVTRTRIEVGDESAPDDLALTTGLVRLASAECPPVQPGPEVPVVEPVAEIEPEPEFEPVAELAPVAGLEPEPEFVPAGPPPPAWEPIDGPVTEPMPAVPPMAPPPPPAPPVVEHDGLTRSGGAGLGEWEPARPGIPGQPPAPPVTVRPVARLVFSGGEDVLVDRSVLVGRAPEPRRHTMTEEPRLVAVVSPHHEISSTHLEIRPGSGADHGSAVVTDLGSTNGTLLIQPGLPPEDLQAGIAVQLIPGAVLDLGDGVTIQVVDP